MLSRTGTCPRTPVMAFQAALKHFSSAAAVPLASERYLTSQGEFFRVLSRSTDSSCRRPESPSFCFDICDYWSYIAVDFAHKGVTRQH